MQTASSGPGPTSQSSCHQLLWQQGREGAMTIPLSSWSLHTRVHLPCIFSSLAFFWITQISFNS